MGTGWKFPPKIHMDKMRRATLVRIHMDRMRRAALVAGIFLAACSVPSSNSHPDRVDSSELVGEWTLHCGESLAITDGKFQLNTGGAAPTAGTWRLEKGPEKGAHYIKLSTGTHLFASCRPADRPNPDVRLLIQESILGRDKSLMLCATDPDAFLCFRRGGKR